MAFLHRKPTRSATDPPPEGLRLTIEEVFWIGAPANAKLDPIKRKLASRFPGTVLLGELTGTGALMPGDFVVHQQGRFEIQAIEVFHQLLDRAEPPRPIGLRLGTKVRQELFSKGQQLQFELSPDRQSDPGERTGSRWSSGRTKLSLRASVACPPRFPLPSTLPPAGQGDTVSFNGAAWGTPVSQGQARRTSCSSRQKKQPPS